MSQARKYAFATEFAPDGTVLRAAPKPLTPEEIEAERAAAYERGKADATAEAERRAAAAIEHLAGVCSKVLGSLDADVREMRAEAAQVALAAARKIAGAALEQFGADRAAAAVEAAMDALRHHPRLIVRVRAEDADALQARLEGMCEAHAYGAAVLVRSEPGLTAGDVIIDWTDGLIRMSPDETTQRVGELIEAALATP